MKEVTYIKGKDEWARACIARAPEYPWEFVNFQGTSTCTIKRTGLIIGMFGDGVGWVVKEKDCVN